MDDNSTAGGYNGMEPPAIAGALIRRKPNHEQGHTIVDPIQNNEGNRLIHPKDLSTSEILKMVENQVVSTAALPKQIDPSRKRMTTSECIRRGDIEPRRDRDRARKSSDDNNDDTFFKNLMQRMVAEQFLENSKKHQPQKRRGSFNVIEDMTVYKRFKNDHKNWHSTTDDPLATSSCFGSEIIQPGVRQQSENTSTSSRETNANFKSTLDLLEEEVEMRSKNDTAYAKLNYTRTRIPTGDDLFSSVTDDRIDNDLNEVLSFNYVKKHSNDSPKESFIDDYRISRRQGRESNSILSSQFPPIDMKFEHLTSPSLRPRSPPFGDGHSAGRRDQLFVDDRSASNITSSQSTDSDLYQDLGCFVTTGTFFNIYRG